MTPELLTTQTMIPLGVAICIIGGGAAWLTKLQMMLKVHDKKLDNISKIYDKLNEISERLARIEGKAE